MLMIAAEEGDMETVKQSLNELQTEEDIDLKNDIGYSPLALAVKNGHEDIAHLLLTWGGNVNSINNVSFVILGWINSTFHCMLGKPCLDGQRADQVWCSYQPSG